MRKGGTEITSLVSYSVPTPHSFTHSTAIYCRPGLCPVSGPRESQVEELMWASSHPLRGTGRTRVLKELTGEKGRARMQTRCGCCLHCPCSGPPGVDLSLKGPPLPGCAAFLSNLPSWALAFSSVNGLLVSSRRVGRVQCAMCVKSLGRSCTVGTDTGTHSAGRLGLYVEGLTRSLARPGHLMISVF